MKFHKVFLFPTLLACLSLSSCYHEFPAGGGGGGGGGNNNGNAFVNVTATSTPSSTIFFPNLVFEAANISIVNSAGIPTTIAGGAGTPPLAFSQMQTNSIYLGHVTLAATNYTTLQVQYLTPFFSNFFNSTNGTVLGCASGAVCLIPNTVPGYGATTLNIPITYSPTANTNTGIRINFDLSKAVTAVGGLTFDFTQPGAITVSPLPPAATSQPTGLDTADNVTGVVTATTGTTVTVRSFADEARTFTSSTAVFEDPLNVCNGAPVNGTCIAVNQNITIDGVINSDGTRTANQIEFLDPAPAVNELEGIITSPPANGQFNMSLTNGMGSTVLIITTPVLVKLSGAEVYAVDPKNLGISTSTLGFQGATDLVVGQTVMVQGGTFNGNGTSITNPTRILLRYSSIGGLVQTPSGTTFNLSGLSSFFTNLVGNSVQVQTFQTTNYDNISNFNGLIGGTTKASVLGLYLNPTSGATQPLLAAKVRSH